jgi:hypothetical protein
MLHLCRVIVVRAATSMGGGHPAGGRTTHKSKSSYLLPRQQRLLLSFEAYVGMPAASALQHLFPPFPLRVATDQHEVSGKLLHHNYCSLNNQDNSGHHESTTQQHRQHHNTSKATGNGCIVCIMRCTCALYATHASHFVIFLSLSAGGSATPPAATAAAAAASALHTGLCWPHAARRQAFPQ